MSQGFVPDTMLVHPMAWLMWVKDPVLREFALRNGGGSFFAQWTGNPASLGNPFYNFGGTGAGQGQTTQATNGAQTGPANAGQLPQNMNAAPVLPGYPLRILHKRASKTWIPSLSVPNATITFRCRDWLEKARVMGHGRGFLLPWPVGRVSMGSRAPGRTWGEGQECVTGRGSRGRKRRVK